MNNPESIEVIKTLITAFTTLLVSLGTWHVSMRQYRMKNESMVRDAIEDVKDTVTKQQLAAIDHYPKLTLYAYAVQTQTIPDAVSAWQFSSEEQEGQ